MSALLGDELVDVATRARNTINELMGDIYKLRKENSELCDHRAVSRQIKNSPPPTDTYGRCAFCQAYGVLEAPQAHYKSCAWRQANGE